MDIGLDPRPSLERAVAAFQRAIEINPDYANAYNNSGIALWRRAVFEQRTGSDPGATLERGDRRLRRGHRSQPDLRLRLCQPRSRPTNPRDVQDRRGLDPSDALGLGRSGPRYRARDQPPDLLGLPRKNRRRAAGGALGDAIRNVSAGHFEAASESAARALTVNPRNAVAYQSAAEVHRWRAEDRLRQGLSIRTDVNQGRRLVEQALALNPGLASAMVTGAALTTIQAEAESVAGDQNRPRRRCRGGGPTGPRNQPVPRARDRGIETSDRGCVTLSGSRSIQQGATE